MKAKAPEKLYFSATEDGTHYYTEGIPFEREYIEYTRTDVFIEKACEWLRTHSEMDFFELIPVANYSGAGNLNKKKMIEDFKNYMEGKDDGIQTKFMGSYKTTTEVYNGKSKSKIKV